jgi:ElaB/YqjD/DUF883 family membrane-anchored ribosome-binding protein
MSSPEEIRADIERTRANLSGNVNQLTDSVNPSNVAKRQADKVKGAVFGAKDKVMGSAASVHDSTSSAGSSVSDAVTGAPSMVRAQASGNPLAAGLIAVGVGWLLGSLLPASDKEQQLAVQVKETAMPLVTEAGKDVADNLRQPAQDAVQSVKETATDAVDTVKDEGSSAASDLKDQAQDAKSTVTQ